MIPYTFNTIKAVNTIFLSLWLLMSSTVAGADLQTSISAEYKNSLKQLFEHFHRNPELSFREFETSARMAAELRSLGIETVEGIGGTGVVGMLRNGDGPTVLVRADMDGLPVREITGLPYASTVTQEDINGETVPVMHACGHDVHITSLVATARQLVQRRNDWQGTVMFVVQPAEERIGGAKAMLDDGLYERFGVPDYALAFHVAAGKPAGKIFVSRDLVASSSDSVDITVFGIGAHGASPHRGKDPVLIASQIVVALQTIISRDIDPLQAGVITVGSIHGGLKHNIIPDEVKLQLTVRSNDQAVRDQLLKGIVRVTEGVAYAAGLPRKLYPRVDLSVESTPVTRNNPELAERVEAAIAAEMGKEMFYESKKEGMGAEDFAYFVETDHKVPGVYFNVGGTTEKDMDAAKKGGTPVASHHSPAFRIEPEAAIVSGTRAMTVAVMELLKKEMAKN